MGKAARRLWQTIAVLALLGFVTLFGLLAALWLEHRTELTLPVPTGPFAVGRTLLDWKDPDTVDPLAPHPGTKRELLVWIWYPAVASGTADDYLPASVRPPASRRGAGSIFSLLTRDLSKVHGHSLKDAPLSPKQSTYPIAIMRAGASSEVRNYSTLAEDLGSHGYIVVAFDAPYRTGLVVFPDGRMFYRTPQNNPELYAGNDLIRIGNKLLAAWTGDTGFALDRLQALNASDPSGRFQGHLDLTRVGFFGHSLGGATALQFCSQDSRCKAAIDIDGAPIGSVIQTSLDRPFMFLLSDHGDFSTDAETRQIKADLESIYSRIPADHRLQVVIRGANHFTFSDDGALFKSRLLRGILRLFGKLHIEGRRQLELTAYCVHSFFDAALNGGSIPAVKASLARTPELRVVN